MGHGEERLLAAASIDGGSPAAERSLEAGLSRRAPAATPRVALNRGGMESTYFALDLVRRHWDAVGEPRRRAVISRQPSSGRVGDPPLLNGAEVPEHDTLASMVDRVELVGAANIAAILVEPVRGGAEVVPAPTGYMEGIADLARACGALLVVDASICAFGRLGTWFGVERWNVAPDLVIFADGVTSGYQPLGGVLLAESIAACLSSPGWIRRDAGVHPIAAATAMANLEVLEEDGLTSRGWELETELAELLKPLAESAAVSHVRAGTGLLASVHFERGFLSGLDAGMATVVEATRERGVVVRASDSSISIAPALTIEREHLYMIADALACACASL